MGLDITTFHGSKRWSPCVSISQYFASVIVMESREDRRGEEKKGEDSETSADRSDIFH